MAFASLSTSMGSPFADIEQNYLRGLYGSAISGGLSQPQFRRQLQDFEKRRERFGGMFESTFGRPMMETTTYQDDQFRYSQPPSYQSPFSSFSNFGTGEATTSPIQRLTTPTLAASSSVQSLLGGYKPPSWMQNYQSPSFPRY